MPKIHTKIFSIRKIISAKITEIEEPQTHHWMEVDDHAQVRHNRCHCSDDQIAEDCSLTLQIGLIDDRLFEMFDTADELWRRRVTFIQISQVWQERVDFKPREVFVGSNYYFCKDEK